MWPRYIPVKLTPFPLANALIKATTQNLRLDNDSTFDYDIDRDNNGPSSNNNTSNEKMSGMIERRLRPPDGGVLVVRLIEGRNLRRLHHKNIKARRRLLNSLRKAVTGSKDRPKMVSAIDTNDNVPAMDTNKMEEERNTDGVPSLSQESFFNSDFDESPLDSYGSDVDIDLYTDDIGSPFLNTSPLPSPKNVKSRFKQLQFNPVVSITSNSTTVRSSTSWTSCCHP